MSGLAKAERVQQAEYYKSIHTPAFYEEKLEDPNRGKPCSRCGHPKPFRAFYRRPGQRDGFTSRCIECECACAKLAARKRKYGITEEQWLVLVALQDSRCAICLVHEDEQPLVVDHCHSSGQVRGLLCSRCNIGLGYFRESADHLIGALRYLMSIGGYPNTVSAMREYLTYEIRQHE